MMEEKKTFRMQNGNTKEEILKNDIHAYFSRWEFDENNTHVLHCHDFFSLDFIYEGEMTQILNDEKFLCPVGTVSLLSPFDYHLYERNKVKTGMISLVFSEDIVFREVLNALNGSGAYICTLDKKRAERMYEDLLEIEKQLKSKKQLRSTMVRALVNRIIADIIQNSPSVEGKNKKRYDIVKKAITYLLEHYREQITLDEVAKMCFVTPEHFCRCFKAQTGLTFKEYIISLRLDYALRLVKYSEYSITAICFESGFSSPSYFTKMFYKRFGKTPVQVRKL